MTHRQEDEAIDWVLLARYFAGELDARERGSVEAWAASHPDRRAELEALGRLWRQAGALPTPERVNQLWAGVARGMAAPPPSREPARPAPAPRRYLRAAGLVAASLLLALLGTGAWNAMSRGAPAGDTAGAARRYETARGQTANIQLTDGTRVILAPASALEVRAFGPTGRREVELVGEAVFHVTHDEARPFLVHAGRAITEDLGTVFAVRAYPDEAGVEVVVVEGRVAFREQSAPERSGTVLEPGQGARLDPAGQVTVNRAADPARHLAWSHGRIVFKNATLQAVAAELERRYDVDLVVPDASVGSRRITLDIAAGPLPDVLDAVAVPLNLHVERNGDSIRLYP